MMCGKESPGATYYSKRMGRNTSQLPMKQGHVEKNYSFLNGCQNAYSQRGQMNFCSSNRSPGIMSFLCGLDFVLFM